MKDIQTKRIEARDRLHKTIDRLNREREEVRLKLKAAEEAKHKKPTVPRTMLQAAIMSLDVRDSHRRHLEMLDHHIGRAMNEARHLESLISAGRAQSF